MKPSFVEGMGRWLGWTDAIALAAGLPAPQAPRTGGAAARATRSIAAESPAAREFDRVRTALARAIADDSDAARERAGDRRRPGRPTPAAAAADEVDFSPHRERCVALQQAMEASIASLRAQAREVVARLSPEMRGLAAIDAVMDSVLGVREQALLAMMPSLLHRHFDRLRQGSPARAVAAGGAPASPWLDQFRQDMQRLLLAELDLRLQPVQGLLEAAAHHATRDP